MMHHEVTSQNWHTPFPFVEIQKAVFRGCGHVVHLPYILPHALLFQKCLLLPLVLQIESNHSRGIDANGALNGGIGLCRNDETDFMMTTHERQFIQYIPERLLNALVSVIISSKNRSTPRCVLFRLYFHNVTNHRVIPLDKHETWEADPRDYLVYDPLPTCEKTQSNSVHPSWDL